MTDAAQILADLRPIHMPPDLDPSPAIAMALLGCAAALVFSGAIRPWLARRSALRRAALQALALSRSMEPGERLVAQAAILRWLIETMSGAAAARQQGEIWLACLDRTLSTHFFSAGPGRVFADALYRPVPDPNAEMLDRALAELFARIER